MKTSYSSELNIEKGQMGKYITYGNCLLYLWIGVALTRGIYSLFSDDIWKNELSSARLPFVILLSSALLISTMLCIGLLLKKEWGRKISISWNIAIGLLVSFVPVMAIIVATDLETYKELFNSNYILGMAAGITFFIFAFGLRSQSVKNHFGT